MNIPSPGDIRNVIAALSDVEPYLEKMFQYRFDSGEVKGHPVGNLMLAAMTDIHGDFSTAVKVMSKILNVRGTVLPTTNDIATLNAVLSTGEIIRGESSITKAGGIIDYVYITPSRVKANEDVLKAIENADYIVMGPGSLYTSIIPNLVISQVSEKIRESAAKKIYISNVMTQHGETDNFKVSDHIEAINKHVGENIFDIVIANSRVFDEDVLASLGGQTSSNNGSSTGPNGSSAGNTGAWLKDNVGWWYINADRTYTTNNWQQIGGNWYMSPTNKIGISVAFRCSKR